MSAELFVVGLSWRTAPVAVREHLAFPEDELGHVLSDVRKKPTKPSDRPTSAVARKMSDHS